MAEQQFRLPDPGEGLLEAEIVEWKVAVGDTVKVNDIVVEVETAKSLVELPIPWAGTVSAIHVHEGDEVEVGTSIITIDDGTDAPSLTAPAAAPEAVASEAATVAPQPAAVEEPEVEPEEEPVKTLVGYGPKASSSSRRPRKQSVSPAVSTSESASTSQAPPAPAAPQAATPKPEPATPAQLRALAKPPVRKLAKDLGIDLTAITPTGAGGIVTREDVQSAADTSRPGPADAADGAGTAYAGYADGEREVRIPIKGVRKVTAAAMVGSAFTAPHVTEWVTVDVSATMELIERLKKDREFRDAKVTPMLILAKAMCVAVKRNPSINSSWDEAAQEIVLKHYVNLGIAAATPRGLIVPNIKDADRMSMRELADAISELTTTAREGRTQPAQMSGGTFTITNVGVFGVDAGTPILNPGESAILAFGAISRRPWVVGEGSEERIEPRWVTTLALSFDHRLIDGELGSKYLADVAALLADPGRALVWG